MDVYEVEVRYFVTAASREDAAQQVETIVLSTPETVLDEIPHHTIILEPEESIS